MSTILLIGDGMTSEQLSVALGCSASGAFENHVFAKRHEVGRIDEIDFDWSLPFTWCMICKN